MAKAAKKAAKAKAPKKAGNGKRSTIAPETALTVLAKENPKRKGSDSAKRFELYKGAKTVGKALDNGVLIGDIHWDKDHGFIKLG